MFRNGKKHSQKNDRDDVQYVNYGDEDEMELYGYKRSKAKTALIYALHFMTVGLLRLFFHWIPRYMLLSTHTECALDVADKVLLVNNYKGKYKTFFVEQVSTISTANLTRNGADKLTYYLTDNKLRESSSIRTFTCKRYKYIWDENVKCFSKLCGLDGIPKSQFHTGKGFTENEQTLRRIVYGTNEIDVPLESIFSLFILEALTPFYIFQVFSLILWICEEYYYYGFVILLMSLFGIASSIVQTRKNQTNLRGTVQQTDSVTVKRADNTFESIPTTALVPGDIFVVPSHGCDMSCDAVLLNGTCIVNESMLTGESVPVMKTALPNVERAFNMKEDNNHVLYCGTKVIQTRVNNDEKVLAVVTNTAFLTAKGQLVRSILYPPPADFKFDQDSYKFIIILTFIAAGGIIYTIVSKSTRHIAFTEILIKSLDAITIVIPPYLPAAMTVGKLYALGRLKRKQIFCINSRIINVTGSINCICFDKTGTLTEDGLDMWGVIPVEGNTLANPVKNVATVEVTSKLIHGMATCHSLTLIEEKIEGDPLDVKMFESTDWSLEEPANSNRVVKSGQEQNIELSIVHQFQFSSTLQRMSVAVRSSNLELFCKGSPEMIVSLSLPQTVPQNLQGVLQEYTEKGYRVIAMGHKILETDLEDIQNINREDVECKLSFLGLIILENKLKAKSTEIIGVLKGASMKVVMITGDNKLTALSVAKECGIIRKGGSVIDVEAKAPTKTEDAKLIFNLSGASTDSFSFAITGDTWKLIKEYFPGEVAKFCARGAVFARMSSQQKQDLVEELKALGYYVAMCGDGSNDCGALKAAHVGISLSEAESSIAAPFTSKTPDISCVPEVIKQGRAALVTSFGIFKFMIFYSLCEFTSALILYGIDCNLTNMEFLYIDLCLVTVFASIFGKTDAYDAKLYPKPPMTSLLSFVPLTSMTLQVLCFITFQLLAYHIIFLFDWFEPFKYTPNKNIFISYENYAVYAVSIFQYISAAVIFSKGEPYRKPLHTNKLFTGILLFMTLISVYIVLYPAKWTRDVLELKVPPEYDGRIIMLILAFCHFVFAYVLEDFVVDFLLVKKVKPIFHNIDRTSKKYLKVEREIAQDTKWRFNDKTHFEMRNRKKTFDNIAFENEGKVIEHIDIEAKAPTKTDDAKLIFNLSGASTDSFSFAITGDTWTLIKEYFPGEVAKFCARGAVFARMSSQQKQDLVEELKALGYYVAMCGDGSNDCGALKAAHVGISLSEAESSIAAPFTSKTPDISCVPEVIKQGRAALVTSFGIFKFMIFYSLCEFTSALILYGIDCNLTNMEFLYIDLCLVTVFASIFGKTDAYDAKLYPKPPMTSLLSFVPLTSMTLQVLCFITFQLLAYHIIFLFDWFEPFKYTPNKNIFISYENYAVYAVSIFQYISAAVIFSKGEPYRKPLHTNKLFTGILLFMTLISVYIVLYPAKWTRDVLELKVPPEYDGRIIMLILAFCHFVFAYVLEDLVVDFLLVKKVKPIFHNIDRTSKKYLKVEREIAQDTKWRFNDKTHFEMRNRKKTFDNIAFENEGV